ncbi:MAG: hypothetical protein ABIH34_02330 [Nanoarchaeota archaeon]
MVERRIIVDGMKLSYKGLFNVTELYKLIDYYFRERAYTKHELKNYEETFPGGKQIEVVKEPYRKITDYAKYVIRVSLTMQDIKEIAVEKDGAKVKLNQGSVEVHFDGFLEVDYEHRWEKKPFYYFLRAIADQFFFKVHTERYEQGLVEEVNELHSQIKGFLNLYRY